MTKGLSIYRAIELLRVVAEFVDQNNLEFCEVRYDDADCDGSCLSADCLAAADELEGGLT